MKNILLILTATAMLTSGAFARHMAVYEDAGTDIPESSPHLSMTFY